MLPPPEGRLPELPVLRLSGQPRGFVVLQGRDDVPKLRPASGLSPDCLVDDRPRDSALLHLDQPLVLGEQPLLLLLEQADALPEELLQALATLLSHEEQQGLSERRRPADRSRHGAGLALVRLVLAALLGHSASALPIERGGWGKPRLASGPWPPLQFNLSHSGSLLLLGVHHERPIGVDLERHRPGIHWPAIARRYLTSDTQAALEATPEHQQLQAFTDAWCSLEASLKAEGRGLASRAMSPDAQGIQLRHYRPWLPPGYSGAVVLLGSGTSADANRGRA